MKTKIICTEKPGVVSQNERPGFSFIEIMIVIVIMAGMIAIVGPMLFGKLDEAKVDQARIQMKSLVGALDLYHLDNSVYPSTEQGLLALIEQPTVGSIPKNWRGPYLRSAKIPKDPWENDYIYQSEGRSISMNSLGADGEEGGDGINADIPLE
ncbi:MAG: type II secretion system major pseudopilin GspG [SAR324 cluster bacterium]|nr:type II secretion system major pseudopilin GspG [SAR324 cluster bacterium]